MNEQGNIRDKFREYENIYKKYFEEFLLSKVDLVNYDSLISQSEFGFGELKNKVKLRSNLDEFLNLKYFYILNSFYVEKLSQSELSVLLSNNKNDIVSLVERTYKNIITKSSDNGGERFMLNYTYSTSLSNYSYNNELVIAIYYGVNKYKYNDKEKYLNNYSKQIEFLKNMAKTISDDFKNKLDLPVKVIFQKI